MRKLGLTLVVVALAALIALVWSATRSANDVTATERESAPLARTPQPSRVDAPAAERSRAQLAPSVEPPPAHDTTAHTAREVAAAPANDTTPRESSGHRFTAVVRGRTVHRDSGRPVPGVLLRFRDATHVAAEMRSSAGGDIEGEFDAVWPVRLEVEPPEGWRVASGAGELAPRQLNGHRALDVLLERVTTEVAGDIHGYLLSESGEWTSKSVPQSRSVLLDLVPTQEPRISTRGEITPIVDAEGRTTIEFLFKDVAPGEYELTLSALDGFRWAPQSLRVSPPADGLTFVRYDKDRTLPLVFEVFDAKTREPIKAFSARSVKLTPSNGNGVFLHAAPISIREGAELEERDGVVVETGAMRTGEYALNEPMEWVVNADGYAPAYGDESAFTQYPDKRVAQVYLTRDWATRVVALARDPAARLAAGAEVLLDGRSVGRTRDDGTLIVRAESAPERVEVRLAGFRPSVRSRTDSSGESSTLRSRDGLLIVYLEPER